MGKYNGLWGLQASALVLALIAGGCAMKPRPSQAYPVEPAEGAGGRYMGGATSGLPDGATRGDVELKETAPLRYVVKKGDTLWDIANHFLLDPWQWPEIWIVNDQVANPHLIYPGDVLTLVWAQGRPGVTLAGDRLSPQVRVLSLDEAIPTIPIEAIRDFLRSPRLVTKDEIKRAPYIIDFIDPHVVGGADNLVFVKKMPNTANYRYVAVKLGRKYEDPDTGEFLGQEVIPTGDLEVRDYGSRTATAQIVKSYMDTRIGDLLLKPPPEAFESHFYPHAPLRRIDARIISVYEGVTEIGQYAVITINRGARDGMEPGHVLDILQSGRQTRDPYTERRETLPDVYAGRAMVFKVESTVSFALVMTADRAIHLLDKAEKPRRR